MRVAFLGYNQPSDGSARPSGGYISKSEAEVLVRALAAERLSQKCIRAFPPQSAFRVVNPVASLPSTLPAAEIPGLKFVRPRTDLHPTVAQMKSAWDWTQEADYLTA